MFCEGMIIGLLFVGDRMLFVDIISVCVFSCVLIVNGMCIVIWLLLKLVLYVVYISGWSWIVLFLISVGLNVWIFKWWSVGVWLSSIGCLWIMLFSMF